MESISPNSSATENLEDKGRQGLALVNEGIEIASRANDRLIQQLDRIDKSITTIREKCAEEGVVIPALNEAIHESNKNRLFQVKLAKYISDMKDETKPLEQRVALVGVMARLNQSIDSIKEL